MISLEHIGIAVDDVAAVTRLYHELLGALPYKVEAVEDQRVRTHFIAAGSAKLELLEALGPESPIAKHVEKRGEGLHHLAFEVEDAGAAMQRLREAGFQPLSDAPRPGADGKRIFFLHPKQTHGVLVEFCASEPVQWTPEMIPYRDGRLAVYEAGRPDHPPVLLLHGAAGSTQLETTPLMRRLEPQFHVLAVDFSGHGGSTFPPKGTDFTADLFADNARAALDHFDVETAHAFGFSMGGNMALQLAYRHPKRIGRIAVHGANADWNDDRAAAMQARLDAEAIARRMPRQAERFDAAHGDWQRLFTAMQAFIGTLPSKTDEMKEVAGATRHPTLVSAVDRDDLFPLAVPLGLHRSLPNARLALLPGDRHALPLAPLDRLAGVLQDHFLAV